MGVTCLHNAVSCVSVCVAHLAGSVPEGDVDGLAVHNDITAVVIEDCRHIFAWKAMGSVSNKQATLTHATITHDDQLNVLHDVAGAIVASCHSGLTDP